MSAHVGVLAFRYRNLGMTSTLPYYLDTTSLLPRSLSNFNKL